MANTAPISSDSAPPSTPPPVVLFSDAANDPSSPPSSPPGFPWDYDHAPTPAPQPPQRTAFSILGKRKVLSPITDNASPAAKKPAYTAKKAEKDGLTQMQISLGQQVQKRCTTCGMEYVASSAEDRKLHERYHKQNAEGYDVGKEFVRAARAGSVFEGKRKGDVICEMDGRDKAGRRAKAQAVLEIVQRELGAVDIDAAELGKVDGEGEPKFRHYLYVRGTRCIGYLLTERIREAREVLPPERLPSPVQHDAYTPSKEQTPSTATSALRNRLKSASEDRLLAENSAIRLSNTPTSASLGISRIWTSSTQRRQNIATALLEAACTDNGERQALPKEMMAFSQPTTSGARLAQRWFGKTFGWKVYVD